MDVEVVAMDPCRGPGTPGTETLVVSLVHVPCFTGQLLMVGVWSTLGMGWWDPIVNSWLIPTVVGVHDHSLKTGVSNPVWICNICTICAVPLGPFWGVQQHLWNPDVVNQGGVMMLEDENWESCIVNHPNSWDLTLFGSVVQFNCLVVLSSESMCWQA